MIPKFRGLRTYKKEWVYGYYIVVEKLHHIIPEHIDLIDAMNKSFEVIPETVGQSIYLKDKNSKEIFEGDIVDNREQIGIVVKKFCFGLKTIKHKKNGWYCSCEDAFKNCEIIGNIHENPELLRVCD